MNNSLVNQEFRLLEIELNNLFRLDNDIYSYLNEFLNSPTKRIRSMVTILYMRAFNKEVNKDLLLIGELIHNASLLHDDVIDEAKERRGKPTLASVFNSHTAILCGDYLLSLATERLIKLQNWNILKRFQNCIKRMSEAEILQYSLRNKIPDKDEYLTIARGKTAELFAAILTSACELTNLDKQSAEKFAINFGTLFQLKNDLERISATKDAENKIYTLKDIIGIEKTKVLMDNYQEEIRGQIKEFPQNVYSEALEDLLGLI